MTLPKKVQIDSNKEMDEYLAKHKKDHSKVQTISLMAEKMLKELLKTFKSDFVVLVAFKMQNKETYVKYLGNASPNFLASAQIRIEQIKEKNRKSTAEDLNGKIGLILKLLKNKTPLYQQTTLRFVESYLGLERLQDAEKPVENIEKPKKEVKK